MNPGNHQFLASARGKGPEDHRLLCDYNHLSSPCVLWNAKDAVWHLYFHTYRYLYPAGGGHQQTCLARCHDLSSHEWEILKNPDGTWKIVLPVTSEPSPLTTGARSDGTAP